MAAGAGAGIDVPSLYEAPQLWPAHIVSSSMALTADSKHRPQDLRAAAGAAARSAQTADTAFAQAPAAGERAADKAAGWVTVQGVNVNSVHAAGTAAGSEGPGDVPTEASAGTAAVNREALQHAPHAAGLGEAASAGLPVQHAAASVAGIHSNAGANNGNAAHGLARDWQARLYLGCVIAGEMRAAVARETGYR